MSSAIADGKTAVDVKTGHRGRAIVKGGQGTATKAVSLLGAIFNFAMDRDMREDNPVFRVKTFKSKKQERFLSNTELARLGDALEEAEATGANPSAVNAIRLLAMTGCRRGEILALRWDEVDFERSCLRFKDSKTGEKVVPVGAAVLKLLTDLPRIADNPHVLPGEVRGTHFVGLPKVWQKIRHTAELDDVRIHDLRHSFASVGAAGGESLLMIGKLLGHQRATTTERYAHLSDDPLKAAAGRISDSIANALNQPQKADSATPISLANRQRTKA
jgi:integrase